MSSDLLMPPGVTVTAPTSMPQTPVSRRRRAETFMNELGSALGEADGLAAKLAEVRSQREIADRLQPEQARKLSENAVQIGRVLEIVERVACDKARRDTLERARELYIDLRVRMEFADKHFASWRSAAAQFERDVAAGRVEEREARENELTEKRAEYEAWVDMAYHTVPGTGIQLL